MSFLPPQCSELSNNVNSILDLVQSESSTNYQDVAVVEASLRKAIRLRLAYGSRLSLKLSLQGRLVQVNQC